MFHKGDKGSDHSESLKIRKLEPCTEQKIKKSRKMENRGLTRPPVSGDTARVRKRSLVLENGISRGLTRPSVSALD